MDQPTLAPRRRPQTRKPLKATKRRRRFLPANGLATLVRLVIPRPRDRRFKSCPRNQFQPADLRSAGFCMSGEQLYCVYVLRNSRARLYIGLSEDVTTRVQQHNAGDSTWTGHHLPWRLVWTSQPLPLGAARKLENLLKRQKGGDCFLRHPEDRLRRESPPGCCYYHTRDRDWNFRCQPALSWDVRTPREFMGIAVA